MTINSSTNQSSLLIVTDLDGSLLDHDNYCWTAAEPCLKKLKMRNVPIIFCTSKTRPEVESLQQQMDLLEQPFICENGALLHAYGQSHIIAEHHPALGYNKIVQILDQLKLEYGFKFSGFSAATADEIVRWTGLSNQQAIFSKQRLASEPILWQDSNDHFTQFQQQLATHHLCLIQGGRFWHVMNMGSQKGLALQFYLQQEQRQQRYWHTIGLGDSPNDLPLLEITNFAVVIRTASAKEMPLQRTDIKNIYHSRHIGPTGWCEGIEYFFHHNNL
ncbi:MAG: HAD-IIB family hydrolase [Acinetobacter sp.]